MLEKVNGAWVCELTVVLLCSDGRIVKCSLRNEDRDTIVFHHLRYASLTYRNTFNANLVLLISISYLF